VARQSQINPNDQIPNPKNGEDEPIAAKDAGAAAPTVNRKLVSSASDSLPTINRAATAAATAALYDARAISLLTEAERAALSPLLDALAWLADAPEEHTATALQNFQAVLDKHAPRLLANPALAAAWEKILAPHAVEGAVEKRLKD